MVYAESIVALIDAMPKIEMFSCLTQYISSFAEQFSFYTGLADLCLIKSYF